MKKYGKFAALTAVILGTLGWLAVAGSGEAKSYYKTIAELRQMGPDAAKKRLRVAGDIEKDSIKRNGGEVSFVLVASLEYEIDVAGLDTPISSRTNYRVL